MIRGTRGLVTTLDERTGSVGDSSTPTRKASVHVRSVTALVARATIAAVIGMPSTSLRNGRCHAFCSISASTSRPSRNRISTSAVIARSRTNAERGSIVDHVQAAAAEDDPGEHEDGGQREERAPRDPRQQRPPDEQRAEHGGCGLVGGHAGYSPTGNVAEASTSLHITVLGKSPAWQDADGACSGYLVEEDATLSAPGLRQRRLLQTAPLPRLRGRRRGRHLPPARRPHPRPRAVRLGAHLRAAPAAGSGRPLARHRQPRAAAALRARGRTRRAAQGVRRRRDARGARRERLRPARVRARRRARVRHAARALPPRPALPAHVRGRRLLDQQRRRALHLRGRQRPQRGARPLRRRHRPADDRGHAPAARARGPARPPHAVGGRRARLQGARAPASCSPTSPTSSTSSGRKTEASKAFGGPVDVAREGAVFEV